MEETTPLNTGEQSAAKNDLKRSNSSYEYQTINDGTTEVENDFREGKTMNNLQSLMNLLKGNIGTGILAIPAACKYGGLWVGLFGILLVGCLATYCMHLLVACSRYIAYKTGKQGLDYGKLVGEAFLIGPGRLPSYSKAARITLYIFLAITQFGFCTVYIVFMATNLKMVIEEYCSLSWADQVYQCLVVLFLIPYLTITNLRILAFFSGIANVCIVFALSVIFYTCFLDIPPVSSRPVIGPWTSLPLYFGIVIFAFEGIGVVLPLENKMKIPRDFTGWSGIINLGMAITTSLIAGIGFFGYLKYGNDIKDSITLNLPHTIFYNSVRLAFVLIIFFTYGVQFYVPIEFLWFDIQSKLAANSFLHRYGEYFLRLLFLTLTFLLAALIPHLDLMISLIGALASTAVAIIIPSCLDILCSYEDGYGRFHWKLIKNTLISLVGFLGFITGTGTTLYYIVQAFSHPAS